MTLNEALATILVIFMFFSLFGLIAWNIYKSPKDD